LTRISEGICIPLNWLHGNPSDHLFVAFWATKRGKLSSNHAASATELPKVRMADVIEDLPHIHTSGSYLRT
jgi:hypothetical protein